MTTFGVIKGVVVIGLSLLVVVKAVEWLAVLFGFATRLMRKAAEDRRFEKAFGYPRSLAIVGDYKLIFSDGAVQDRRLTLGEIDTWPVASNEQFATEKREWRIVEIQDKDGLKVWPK